MQGSNFGQAFRCVIASVLMVLALMLVHKPVRAATKTVYLPELNTHYELSTPDEACQYMVTHWEPQDDPYAPTKATLGTRYANPNSSTGYAWHCYAPTERVNPPYDFELLERVVQDPCPGSTPDPSNPNVCLPPPVKQTTGNNMHANCNCDSQDDGG